MRQNQTEAKSMMTALGKLLCWAGWHREVFVSRKPADYTIWHVDTVKCARCGKQRERLSLEARP